ncbi:hypothetical protein MAR_024867 [Mya arenaria]|uniref:Uncharacterized protein n=1 Tax=Mya arenaria TaxID=6604 RepID=A0ABY7DSV6_MYAAR|nr:hypothetical protein MAR_024867 [Mya arenaria]
MMIKLDLDIKISFVLQYRKFFNLTHILFQDFISNFVKANAFFQMYMIIFLHEDQRKDILLYLSLFYQ